MEYISIGSNWIRGYRHGSGRQFRRAWYRCGTIRSPTAHRRAITSHRLAPSQTITNRAPFAPRPLSRRHHHHHHHRIPIPSPLSPSHSVRLLLVRRGSVCFNPIAIPPPARRITTGALSINISDRLAPTSQECDTARNSFELHISLGPAK